MRQWDPPHTPPTNSPHTLPPLHLVRNGLPGCSPATSRTQLSATSSSCSSISLLGLSAGCSLLAMLVGGTSAHTHTHTQIRVRHVRVGGQGEARTCGGGGRVRSSVSALLPPMLNLQLPRPTSCAYSCPPPLHLLLPAHSRTSAVNAGRPSAALRRASENTTWRVRGGGGGVRSQQMGTGTGSRFEVTAVGRLRV